MSGGAEAQIRKTMFTYNANANLVLQTDHTVRRDIDAPTGEPESLLNVYTSTDLRQGMGTRIQKSKPQKPDRKILKKRQQKWEEDQQIKRLQRICPDDNVENIEVHPYYQPTTNASKAVFGKFLNILEKVVGGQPRSLMRNLAHNCLCILKNKKNPVAEKQRLEINLMIPSHTKFNSENFHELLSISRQILDFNPFVNINPDDVAADDPQVGVLIENETEENDILMEMSDDSDSSAEETNFKMEKMPQDFQERERQRQAEQNLLLGYHKGSEEMDYEQEEFEVNPKDVHAHWLLGKIGEHIKDATEKKEKESEIFEILERDSKTLENELLENLGPKKFQFAQFLIRNKHIIVWCTKLKKVENNETKYQAIASYMNKIPHLAKIYQELHKTHGTLDARQKKVTRDQYKAMQKLRKRTIGVDKNNMQDLSQPAKWFSKKDKLGLDLDSLEFRSLGHFMSDTNWKLRKGAKYINTPGLQEIFIPAVQTSKIKWKRLNIDELPNWTHPAFKTKKTEDELINRMEIKSLNEIQTQCYECAFKSSQNMLVCAPTGAGKTNIALLTILREIGIHRESGKISLDEFKVVYIAPMKSLVREIVGKFNKSLNQFGIQVAEFSGDTQITKDQLQQTQMIVSTPEKWDIVTRKGMDRSYTSLVKLIIFDEIHMLHDERGPILEAIIARTIRHVETTKDFIRLIGLSATLPNYDDVAIFLRVNLTTGLFYFDGSFRPCPLIQRFGGVTYKKPIKQFKMINKLCYKYCEEQFSRNNQVIVFVHSRKETYNTAKDILEKAKAINKLEKILPPNSHSFDILKEESENCSSTLLKELLPHGIGIHHAGLNRDDRSLIEDLFHDEHIRILISTATLAYGVNLPAHAVIVKGTQIYNPQKGKWVEISMQDVMQMFGRAGRPGFDSTGEAYLITQYKEFQYYLPLLNEQLPIESQMISKLADTLNAEIVLGTVTNLKEATIWLAYTYLFVRMIKNPEIYHISKADLYEDNQLEQRRIDLAHTAAIVLDKSNLIKYDKKSGSFQVTELGRVCAHYYLTHSTIQTFNDHLKPTMSDIEIFRIFSLADEFKYMGVREEEQNELSILQNKVPIPVKEPVTEATTKVNILLQVYIARLKLNGYALMADMCYITQSAGRLMRALFEITLKRRWAPLACRTLNLCKMIKHRMWSIESPLRQFKGKIPNAIIRKVEKSKFSWDSFFDMSSEDIGQLINFSKYEKDIQRYVHRVPRLELKGHVQTITRTVIKVELKIEADFRYDEEIHGTHQDFFIIVEDIDGEKILHYEYFVLRKKFSREETRISFIIPIYNPLPPQYFVRVISDTWLGSESIMPISFRHLLLPEKFPLGTELLDLRPLKIICLQDNAPDAMLMYKRSGIMELNSIQTQVFSSFFKYNDNIFLGAPSGSGKTLCAELAIIKVLEEYSNGKCVYVSPIESMAKQRAEDWKKRFRDELNYEVNLLTGDSAADLRLMSNSHVIITNPVNWDKMSRPWRRKNRQIVREINLFIIDDIHLISGEQGSTLEMIVSRMRYMENQTGNQMRFIALSTTVANYNNLADWIGATNRGRFNFPLSNRQISMDMHVSGSDINSYEDRQIAFLKPAYSYINRFSQNDPVIIFAPNRKYTRTISSDLVALTATEEDSFRFLHLDRELFEPHIQKFKSESLKTCLKHGIAYIHKFTNQDVKKQLKFIFQSDATQILVIEKTLAWNLDINIKSSMVIIMGTSYYDGIVHSFEDYKISDIIRMIGYAQRPGDQREMCTSIVFTHTSKIDFYKKFLQDPFPVESHLDYELSDNINAEIVSRCVKNTSDAVDLLTWTFYSTRLPHNPNYYSLKAVTSTHLSSHFSELVDQTLDELEQAHCITRNNLDVSSQNAGMIAAYYYIRTSTVDIFSKAISPNRRLKGLMEILCIASEYDDFPVRMHEDIILQRLIRHLPLKISKPNFISTPTKVNILFQTHFSRQSVGQELGADRDKIIVQAIPLLWALIDLFSTEQYLKSTLICLELCQMMCQALWDTDSSLLQLPHLTREKVKEFRSKGVQGIFDLIELEENQRDKLLASFDRDQLKNIAKICNLYPNLEVNFELQSDIIYKCETMKILVKVEREDLDEQLTDEKKDKIIKTRFVNCPRFKGPKVETWFLIVGYKNTLATVKRFTMNKILMSFFLRLTAPERPGKYEYSLYLMSDSYLGVDQEFKLNFKVEERVNLVEDSLSS